MPLQPLAKLQGLSENSAFSFLFIFVQLMQQHFPHANLIFLFLFPLGTLRQITFIGTFLFSFVVLLHMVLLHFYFVYDFCLLSH